MINGLLAVLCLAGAIFCVVKFQQATDSGTMYMVGGIVLAILMVVFGVMFMSGRVNKSEDIHITE